MDTVVKSIKKTGKRQLAFVKSVTLNVIISTTKENMTGLNKNVELVNFF